MTATCQSTDRLARKTMWELARTTTLNVTAAAVVAFIVDERVPREPNPHPA